MGRISNKDKYPQDVTLSLEDYLVGTDSITGDTKTFTIATLLGILSGDVSINVIDNYATLEGRTITFFDGQTVTIPELLPDEDNQTASEVSVDVLNFGNNLSESDTNVQKALETINNLNLDNSGTGLQVNNFAETNGNSVYSETVDGVTLDFFTKESDLFIQGSIRLTGTFNNTLGTAFGSLNFTLPNNLVPHSQVAVVLCNSQGDSVARLSVREDGLATTGIIADGTDFGSGQTSFHIGGVCYIKLNTD